MVGVIIGTATIHLAANSLQVNYHTSVLVSYMWSAWKAFPFPACASIPSLQSLPSLPQIHLRSALNLPLSPYISSLVFCMYLLEYCGPILPPSQSLSSRPFLYSLRQEQAASPSQQLVRECHSAAREKYGPSNMTRPYSVCACVCVFKRVFTLRTSLFALFFFSTYKLSSLRHISLRKHLKLSTRSYFSSSRLNFMLTLFPSNIPLLTSPYHVLNVPVLSWNSFFPHFFALMNALLPL